jgi:hypothetical protein
MEELLKKLFAPKPTSDMSGFRFADLFDNERWRTAQRDSFSPKRGELAVEGDPFSGVSYRQYVPRPKKDVTEKVTVGDDGRTTSVITSKYIDEGPVYGFRMFDTPSGHRQFRPDDGIGYTPDPSFPPERLADMRRLESGFTPARFMPSTFAEEGPGMGSYAPWSDRAGARPPMERGPVRTTGNPFGYPMYTAIQGPPRYTDVYQEMSGATRMYPPQRHTSEQTFPYNMIPLVRPEITPITTQSVPQGNRVPLSFNQQSQLNRFPYSGMAPMSDADKVRMLELLLLERDD